MTIPRDSTQASFWGDEWVTIGPLIDKALGVLKDAALRCDEELSDESGRFLAALIPLRRMVVGFKEMPDAPLHIVAHKLGLTRNGLYFRLETFALSPKVLRRTGTTVMKLIDQSVVLAPLRDRILSSPVPPFAGR